MRTFLIVLTVLWCSPAIAKEMSGDQAAKIFDACAKAAQKQCPRNSIYCDSYRRSFVKVCMVRNDVPPELIIIFLY